MGNSNCLSNEQLEKLDSKYDFHSLMMLQKGETPQPANFFDLRISAVQKNVFIERNKNVVWDISDPKEAYLQFPSP